MTINHTSELTAAQIEIGKLTFEIGCLKADLQRALLQVQVEQMTITATIEMLNKRVVIE